MATEEGMRVTWDAARAAGARAAAGCGPAPMVVRSGTDEEWRVPEGPCGFAWITVRPGACEFARWLRSAGLGRTAHGGGTQVWIHDYGQSHARKVAHAEAAAACLRSVGISARAGERLD